MNTYIGTKVILAKPMTRQEYNDYRGWQLPADEDGHDAGMLVEYVDGGKANDSRHAGYISWSPMDVFHRAYRPVKGMTFGLALEALKGGMKVSRAGWNGKGQYLYLIEAADLPDGLQPGDEPKLTFTPVIAIRTTANQVQVGWLASQSDMLSEDWEIVG